MKLKYIALCAGLVSLAFTSCNDFLDTVPDTRVKLTTVESCRKLMMDAYTSTNYAIPCEFSSDNVVDNNAPSPSGMSYNLNYYEQTDEELYQWKDVKMGMSNDSPSGIWSGCYGAIASCNAVLEALEDLEKRTDIAPEEREKIPAIRAEARISRAYHAFILVNVFSMPYRGENQTDLGVPYPTKPETTVRPHYDRGTVPQTYAAIEKDLLLAIDSIDDGLYQVPKYHFNKQAAYAFAARFYLFKREYDKVEKYATLAFNGQDPATLMQDGWTKKAQFYGSSDIYRYWTSTDRPGVFMCFATYSTASRRYGQRFSLNYFAKRSTIQGPGLSWVNIKWTRTSAQDEINKKFAMHPCFQSLCYYRGNSEYGEFFVGNSGELFEYTDKIQGIGYAHMVRAEFTAEETLLCRAEARAFMGDYNGAIDDIIVWDNAMKKGLENSYTFLAVTPELIKQYYSNDKALDDTYQFGIVKPINIETVCPIENAAWQLTAEKTPYVQCIQHLRRIQNVHNGMRWFDIKRFGLAITHEYGRFGSKLTLKSLDPRYALQLPSEVLSAGMTPTYREPVDSAKNSGNSDVCISN